MATEGASLPFAGALLVLPAFATLPRANADHPRSYDDCQLSALGDGTGRQRRVPSG